MPGPLTPEELRELWKSVTDAGYHQPLIEGGIEFVEQSLHQHARVSTAIDRSTQALYLLPWSGQTAPPASGARLATVDLEMRRAVNNELSARHAVVFPIGQLAVDHVTTDFGENGAQEVLTGRRYLLSTTVVLLPGEAGPVTIPFASERAGTSYNFPLSGTIRRIHQDGVELTNGGAAVTVVSTVGAAARNSIALQPVPDVLTASQVGQYVKLEAAAAGYPQYRRVIDVLPPGELDGGVVILDTVATGRVTASVGTLEVGEVLTWTGGEGILLRVSSAWCVYEVTSGASASGVLTGSTSGATVTVVVERGSALPATAFVSWRVMSWEDDFALSLTNPEQPSGGMYAVLDELGLSRNLPRSDLESDEVYRERIVAAGDVVSPNAVLRAANRVLEQYNLGACLREVGTEKLPGFFYDVNDGVLAHVFAFDLDLTDPVHKWKVILDWLEMRAFMMIGVEPFPNDNLGLILDERSLDASVPEAFFDGGFEVSNYARVQAQVWHAVGKVHAGGVSYEVYPEVDGCVP